MEPLNVAAGVEIPAEEVLLEFSRSSGPGGQHVNRRESRVTLRLSLKSCTGLSEADRQRMMARLQSRLTKEGELLVSAERHRDRERNREEAWSRLESLLRWSHERPRIRRPTRPTRGSRERRLQQKRQRSDTKRNRRRPPPE